MWRDPMDELIADLERIVPPERQTFGGGHDVMTEMQLCDDYMLRRADEAYPDGPPEDDPELQEWAERRRRATNRWLGRPDDWTPGSK